MKLNIPACVAQISLGMNNKIGWISDGSGHKAYFGKCLTVNAMERGLRIRVNLPSGRVAKVNWRMKPAQSQQICDILRNSR